MIDGWRKKQKNPDGGAENMMFFTTCLALICFLFLVNGILNLIEAITDGIKEEMRRCEKIAQWRNAVKARTITRSDINEG